MVPVIGKHGASGSACSRVALSWAPETSGQVEAWLTWGRRGGLSLTTERQHIVQHCYHNVGLLIS